MKAAPRPTMYKVFLSAPAKAMFWPCSDSGMVQNIAFAGADKKTLYIVGRGAAFKVRLLTAGYAGRAK